MCQRRTEREREKITDFKQNQITLVLAHCYVVQLTQ